MTGTTFPGWMYHYTHCSGIPNLLYFVVCVPVSAG